MIRFSIAGIPVTILPFFWVTLAILGALNNGGGATSHDIYRIAVFMLAGFISILIHELGHALTAQRYGARCQIVLESFGGYAAYQGVAMTRLQRFLITAAGPALQALFGLLIYWILKSQPQLTGDPRYFLTTLIVISWFWAAFNLLPILPMDGGRMLDAAMGPHRIRTTLWISITWAIVIAIVMLVKFGSLIAPILLGSFAWQAWKQLQQSRWR